MVAVIRSHYSPKSTADSTRIMIIFISPMTVVVTDDVTLMTNACTMLYMSALTQPSTNSPVVVVGRQQGQGR